MLAAQVGGNVHARKNRRNQICASVARKGPSSLGLAPRVWDLLRARKLVRHVGRYDAYACGGASLARQKVEGIAQRRAKQVWKGALSCVFLRHTAGVGNTTPLHGRGTES